jgi:hypothetical protein
MLYCRDEAELARELRLEIDPGAPDRLRPIGAGASKPRSSETEDRSRAELDRGVSTSPGRTLPQEVPAPAKRRGFLWRSLKEVMRAIGTAGATPLRLVCALLFLLAAAMEWLLAAATLALRKQSSRMGKRCHRRRPSRNRRRKS